MSTRLDNNYDVYLRYKKMFEVMNKEFTVGDIVKATGYSKNAVYNMITILLKADVIKFISYRIACGNKSKVYCYERD